MKSLSILFFLLLISCNTSVYLTKDNKSIPLIKFGKKDIFNSIYSQGDELFRKSKCIDNIANGYKDTYKVVPYVIVFSKVPIQELSFESKNELLNSLYTKRESKRGYLDQIFWEVYVPFKGYYSLKAVSNDNRFNCFDDLKKANSKIQNVKYRFYIESTSLHTTFNVMDNDDILVEVIQNKREGFKEIMGVFELPVFNEMYRNGEIEFYNPLSVWFK